MNGSPGKMVAYIGNHCSRLIQGNIVLICSTSTWRL